MIDTVFYPVKGGDDDGYNDDVIDAITHLKSKTCRFMQTFIIMIYPL